MKPKKSSYTFVTIPSPVIVPEAAAGGRSPATHRAAATTAPAAVPSVSSANGPHTTFTAAAADVADRWLSAATVTAPGAPDAAAAAAPVSAAAAAAASPCRNAAAAGHAVIRSAASQLGIRRGRSRSTMPTVGHKAAVLHEAVRTRSEARDAASSLEAGQLRDTAEKPHDGDTSTLTAARPFDVSVATSMDSSSSKGTNSMSYLCRRTEVSGSEGSSTATSVSTGQPGSTSGRPQPSLFSPEPWPSSVVPESRSSTDAAVVTPAKQPPRRAATAGEESSASRRSQQRGSRDRQEGSSSSTSPGLPLPSSAEAALPPLAVEDAAVMLREFAALLRRLESTGQQVLQREKQPQSVSGGDHMRQRFSLPEQLQQQAVVCSSLSTRLQRLFEGNAASVTQPPSLPGTVGTAAASPGDDDSPQRKRRHQLLLPGIRSRAQIQEGGSGEEGWPDDASSTRIALRTLGTFSTMGSNSSASFELAGAYNLPQNSLEQHRGRLRLAKLKEDFERLQQKHERLVTLYNIRMLLPLSSRNSNGNIQRTGNCATYSPDRGAPDAASTSSGPATAAVIEGDALMTDLHASGKENSEDPAPVGLPARSVEGVGTTATVEGTSILEGLDFAHFADTSGLGEDSSATTPTAALLAQRRRSSSTIMCRGVASSRQQHLPARHSVLRYTSSATSSSSSSSRGRGGTVGRERGLLCRTESDLSRFYSFNDPNSFSFGDAVLPPIYLGPAHEWGAGNAGVGAADGSASRSASAAPGFQQRQVQQQRQWGLDGNRKASTDFAARWRRRESSLLFPGEASLENVWRPTRLQEVDEGFEEQQRREQLQQLQHIEECVHVLHELHVQIADEVETAVEPLAAVAAETEAAAVQTAQANRELVTASLRRSRWWGVQGGGVAAAAGVVVGGLAGGPIGAAVGLICGAFVGATSGSALEREHRHRLSRLVRDKTRRKNKEARQGEQHTQTGSAGSPALGANQQQQACRGEQELVSRARDCETAIGERRVDEAGGRSIRSRRATVETRRACPKEGQLGSKQQLGMRGGPISSNTTTLPQKAESAAHRGYAQQEGQQRRDEHFRPHQQGRSPSHDIAFQDNNGASSSSIAATQRGGRVRNRSAPAVDSRCGTRDGADICNSHSPTAANSSRSGQHTNSGTGTHLGDTRASRRRGDGQTVKHAAARRRKDQHISRSVPLPALLGLGWGGSSVWYPDKRISEAAGPQSLPR